MSDAAFVLASIAPAAFAVMVALVAGRNRVRSQPVAIAGIGLFALVAGFFATFTVAWGVSSSAFLFWLTAISVGVVIGLLGHLVIRENVNG